MGNQHIISLEASNVKRIKAVNISTDGAGTVVLSGANGAGKSSVLDAICMAINGGKAIPEQPIRKGASKASIVLKTEELEITRTFTANGSYLEVKDSKGKVSGPQSLLDKMVALVGFDPLAFSRMDAKAQAKEMLRVCPVKIDLDDNAKKTAEAVEARRNANRDVKRVESVIASMPQAPEGLPKEFVSVEDLAQQLEQINSELIRQSGLKRDIIAIECHINNIETEIQQHYEAIKVLQSDQENAEKRLVSARADVERAVDPSEQKIKITQQIKDSTNINAQIRAVQKRAEAEAELKRYQKAASAEDKKIDALAEARAAALAEAPFPINGLSISDAGTVLLNGVPFSQASTSEQIRVGIKLAAAANPTLRVAFIRDGSLLDSKAMKEIGEIAQEHDLQIWIERVDDSSPAAIQVVDGETLN